MKPNAPGEWHSRDGRRVMVYEYLEELKYREPVHMGCPGGYKVSDLKGDDWLPAEPPKFPELPPKPPLVLSKVVGDREPDWRAVISDHQYRNIRFGTVDSLHLLDVIPHPNNDPEAVRLVEQAKNR